MTSVTESREFKIGVLLGQNGFQEEAIDCFRRVLYDNGDDASTLVNLGVCHRQLNYFKNAEDYLQRAWEIIFRRDNGADKKLVHAVLTNLGSLYEDLGQFDSATMLHKQAYDTFPELPATNINYAYCLMREGRWLEAWPKWEWGRSQNVWAYPVSLPRWTGREDLRGKKLLVCREGGYGDVFMYMRWFPQIKAMGASIHLWAWRSLETLLAGHWAIDEFIPTDESTILNVPSPELQEEFKAKYDYYVPLMSIPACLKANGPPVIHGATIEDSLRPHSPMEKGRIGIAWRAEEASVPRKHRSLPAENSIPRLAKFKWVSLIPEEGFGNIDIPLTRESTWLDTAREISRCSLVISVDTAVAHLAGSIGVPCWTLLPKRIDWKWGLPERPIWWYPGMRYYYQHDPISWQHVIDGVVEELNGR